MIIEPTQKNENLTSDADLHAQLEAEAYSDDIREEQTGDSPEQSTSANPVDEGGSTEPDRATDTGATGKPNDNPEPSADGIKRGPDGKFLPKDAAPTPAPTETQAEPVKTESAYQKAQNRLAEQWKRTEQDKLETRQALAEAKQIRDEVLRARQEMQAAPQGQPRFDAKQYAKIADEFQTRGDKLMDEGDIEGAKQQYGFERQARRESAQFVETESKQAEAQFNAEWRSDAEAACKEVPELGTAGSDLSKEMMQLLSENPLLGIMKGGFRKGYEILQMRKEAADASGLRTENTTLKAEIERLTKLTAPSGGKDASKHAGPAKPEDMNLQELHATLEREAELADAA